MKKNCMYLKQKINRSLECKKYKKLISIKECNNCKFKEYQKKITVLNQYQKKSKKSSSIAKLERNRKSVFTTDLNHCIICKDKKDNLHEIFFGKNRLNSIKYNLVIPLCFKCHLKMHQNKEWQEFWHIKGQLYWENFIGTRNEFINIFRKNYIKK